MSGGDHIIMFTSMRSASLKDIADICQALSCLVGKYTVDETIANVMRETKGRQNPEIIRKLLARDIHNIIR